LEIGFTASSRSRYAGERIVRLKTRKDVKLYTDGGCINNPGPGGYGIVLLYGTHRRELSGGFRRTTNNRMEIFAAIAGLEALKEPCRVTLFSDSQYLVHAMQKGWARRWQASGWKRSSKERALNPDLWERLLELCRVHEVRFEWVRGHAGEAENERCDELATAAARGENRGIDEVYEKESP
jgi:ribonuclease HI